MTHPTPSLPTTLAQRVRFLRESQGITEAFLAKRANIPVEQVLDIEAGIELFLSPMVRQKLARVLKISSRTLQEVEKTYSPDLPRLPERVAERFKEEILYHPDDTYHCPFCQSELYVRMYHRRDLEDNLLLEAKVNCTKCLFRL